MKALITGVNGFVGGYLKGHLIERDLEVVGTDISSGKNVDHRVDLLDRRQVEELINEVRPDYVFHLAAQSSVKLSWEKPELTMKVNVGGTGNMLDAVRKNAPEARVLVVSSADVYGVPSKVPISEQDEAKPLSPYGKSKLEQEKLALSSGLNVVVSRSFTHTGPGQKPIFVCSELAKQVAEIENGKEAAITVGDVSIERDFTDVRDIVRAYLLALEKGDSCGIYNICSGKSHSIKKVLDTLVGFTEKDIEVKVEQKKLRKNDIPILQGNNSKFAGKTGWKPEIGFSDTLRDVLDYWRQNL